MNPRHLQIPGLVALLWLAFGANVLPAMDPTAARARTTLHEILRNESSWIQIHAAEALIAAGESGNMRAFFLQDLPALERKPHRIGVWRVLANISPPLERRAWIAKIEAVYLDPAAPDRIQAIETLCKLGHRVAGAALERVTAEAGGQPSTEMALALWALQLAGGPNALSGLGSLLRSPDPTLRENAAYALRWLRATDPGILELVARAAESEPVGNGTSAYLLSAALSLRADPDKITAWRALLEDVLLHGEMHARFEACQTLIHYLSSADLPRFTALLDDSGADTRVGIASIILHINARSGPQPAAGKDPRAVPGTPLAR